MKTAVMIIAATLMLCSAVSAEMLIIVNKAVPVSQISPSEISKIFLGQNQTWDDGTKISVGVLQDGAVHDDFLEQIVQKSSAQFDNYWKRMIFKGSCLPPSKFASEAELLKFVASTSGAIGYIDSATPHSNVKVVSNN